MKAYFDRFEISMTKKQAFSASHPGSCDLDVLILSTHKKIKRQIAKIHPDSIRAELAEYGSWDNNELLDDDQNIQRILWIAAGNIIEECGGYYLGILKS